MPELIKWLLCIKEHKNYKEHKDHKNHEINKNHKNIKNMKIMIIMKNIKSISLAFGMGRDIFFEICVINSNNLTVTN